VAATAADDDLERAAADNLLLPDLAIVGSECCICSTGGCQASLAGSPNRGLVYMLVQLKSMLADRRREVPLLMPLLQL
jgi:hypothetical protein